MSYAGIDIGSSYIKIWHESESGELILSRNLHHRGSPRDILIDELSRLFPAPVSLCLSGSVQSNAIKEWYHEGILAEIEYIRGIYPHKHLLIFGAEKIELIHFDYNGQILSYRTNPACAAGTGSFLDEQLSRLGIGFNDLPDIAIEDDAPMVASRCAVFAKTDLIHLQQDGYGPETMYNGLCKGLVISGVKSVFGGNIPDGDGIILSGGLLANPHIKYFLKKILPKSTIVHTPAFCRARGLCYQARSNGYALGDFFSRFKSVHAQDSDSDHIKRLTLAKSTFPSDNIKRERDGLDNEIWHDIKPGEDFDAYIGVDVGSTSTKAVIIDETLSIRLDIYTRTAGNPIQAARNIFKGIRELQEALGFDCRIKGCSTTGSGRKLIGSIIGADYIVNEISAHAKGAKTVDEDVRTIFEIGGQDSKFIRLEHGRIVDVNMNYVCAAGTGSFVEEQANTLGIGLDEISDHVMGVLPLTNSDRCTVFMNQEVNRQLASGNPKDRILAGVLLSVFKNYLNRVVGNRSFSRKKIVFQGATARNKGLVAALEQVTGAQVMVSPFCHVMGAYGSALLVRERLKRPTSFRGLTIPEIDIREFYCKGCENTCKITTVKMGSKKLSWGYMCGREPGSRPTGKKANPSAMIREELLRPYQKRINSDRPSFKVPALGLYEEFSPLFHEISKACGINIEICNPSKEEIQKELASIGTGDFCFPAKVFIASTNVVLKNNPGEKIFLPFLIQDKKDRDITPRSLYCPFITGISSFYREGEFAGRVFSPIIDLSLSVSRQASHIRAMLSSAGIKGIPTSLLKRSIATGMASLDHYRQGLISKGKDLLEKMPRDENYIVILGRSYNLYHSILNLGIPELIESLGYTVIFMDVIPDEADNKDIMDLFPDMYWYQGQKILKKAMTIKNMPNMFPLMLSNFSCGPDSFILSYFEEVSKDKPYLILELDEHGSATGYQTRIEAFCDMIDQHKDRERPQNKPHRSRIRYQMDNLKDRTNIWIPQMHPYIPQLWASVLRHHGFNAFNMGDESLAECNLGRSLCRGSECLPSAITIGKFISVTQGDNDSRHVLLMPRAEGPCRFGQYATLQSRILERAGLEKANIFSPTSENGYTFLSPEVEQQTWKIICLGDALFKLRCRSVPYHPDPEHAKILFKEVLDDISEDILRGRDWKGRIASLLNDLTREIDYDQPRKPLVGIVGEIFVRLNTFSNQNVIEVIESSGGEAWLTPMAEWFQYVWNIIARKNNLKDRVYGFFKKHYLHMVEKDIMKQFSPILDDMIEPSINKTIKEGQSFIPVAFEGEAILTLGRAKLFEKGGASLIVNCSPFGCMPGRITSYIFQRFPDFCKVPVINLFFDGTGDIASQVSVYLKSITQLHSHRYHQHTSSFRIGPSRVKDTGIPDTVYIDNDRSSSKEAVR